MKKIISVISAIVIACASLSVTCFASDLPLIDITPQKLGDVNNDKKINSSDALMVLMAAVGNTTLTDKQKKAADVDKNNKVNSSDALMILQYRVGVIQSF